MSGRVVSAYTNWSRKQELYIRFNTDANVVNGLCTLQFCRSICEAILRIHLIECEIIKVEVYENQQNSVSG